MSSDAVVTRDLIQTLADGRDGFTAGADKLDKDGETALAQTFRDLGAQRGEMSDELEKMAATLRRSIGGVWVGCSQGSPRLDGGEGRDRWLRA